jgi:hypothetical protein
MTEAATTHLRMVLPPDPWTKAIEEHRVTLPSVSWECNTSMDNAPDRFVASVGLDVGENGVRHLVLKRLRGEPPVALPIFLGREHMQRNVLVPADSPIRTVQDLVGKKVGSWLTPQSGTGAGALMMLEQAYGLPLTEVDWYLGDPSTLVTNRMGLRLSQGPRGVQATLDSLRSREYDAILVTLRPRFWSLFGPDVIHLTGLDYQEFRPLIADPRTIADAYQRTGLYPVSDLLVVAPELITDRPDLPGKLVGLFSEANRLARDYMTPEEIVLADREIELLGRDPHQYGLSEDLRHNLASFMDFEYRLGALDRVVDPEELFAPGSV